MEVTERFWEGADETVGHVAEDGAAAREDAPSRRRAAPFVQQGFKTRKYFTPAGEPTPATRYMKMHSMATGDALLLWQELGDATLETPELNLMYTVLQEALKDYRRHWSRDRFADKRLLFREAKNWIFDTSEKAKAWPYSFVNICNALDIDGDELRRTLGLLYAEDRRKTRGWTRLTNPIAATR